MPKKTTKFDFFKTSSKNLMCPVHAVAQQFLVKWLIQDDSCAEFCTTKKTILELCNKGLFLKKSESQWKLYFLTLKSWEARQEFLADVFQLEVLNKNNIKKEAHEMYNTRNTIHSPDVFSVLSQTLNISISLRLYDKIRYLNDDQFTFHNNIKINLREHYASLKQSVPELPELNQPNLPKTQQMKLEVLIQDKSNGTSDQQRKKSKYIKEFQKQRCFDYMKAIDMITEDQVDCHEDDSYIYFFSTIALYAQTHLNDKDWNTFADLLRQDLIIKQVKMSQAVRAADFGSYDPSQCSGQGILKNAVNDLMTCFSESTKVRGEMIRLLTKESSAPAIQGLSGMIQSSIDSQGLFYDKLRKSQDRLARDKELQDRILTAGVYPFYKNASDSAVCHVSVENKQYQYSDLDDHFTSFSSASKVIRKTENADELADFESKVWYQMYVVENPGMEVPVVLDHACSHYSLLLEEQDKKEMRNSFINPRKEDFLAQLDAFKMRFQSFMQNRDQQQEKNMLAPIDNFINQVRSDANLSDQSIENFKKLYDQLQLELNSVDDRKKSLWESFLSALKDFIAWVIESLGFKKSAFFENKQSLSKTLSEINEIIDPFNDAFETPQQMIPTR